MRVSDTSPDDKKKKRSVQRRYNTHRLQRAGWRFLIRRQEDAFLRRDVRGLSNPFSAQTGSLSVGLFAIGLAMAIGFLVSFMHPRPDRGMSEIITTQAGGMFVMFGAKENDPVARLHPVTNLASARLIVGKPADSSVVKNATLEGIPRGPLMGIPSAPNNLEAHKSEDAAWTVCDERNIYADLSLTKAGAVSTSVIAGKNMIDPDAKEMLPSQGILAHANNEDKRLWLIFNAQRTEIGPEDFATQAALGITPKKVEDALTLSAGLIDSIDIIPTLTIPFVDNRGRVSQVVEGHAIGDVLVVGDPKGSRDYYLVADQGVQRINSLITNLLVNTGSRQIVEPDAAKVTQLPQVTVIDTSRYPESIPDIISPDVVCLNWEKEHLNSPARARILTGDKLPVTDENKEKMIDLLKPVSGVQQADKVLIEPGKGWFVALPGTPNATDERRVQQLYIDDSGVRYFLAPVPGKGGSGEGSEPDLTPTVTALGLNWQRPAVVPWSIAKLFLQGSTLSRQNALVEHGFIPPNLHGVPSDPEAGLYTPPPADGEQ